jgi:hypothetical protein
MSLGSCWNHVLRRVRIVKAHASPVSTPTSDLDRRSERPVPVRWSLGAGRGIPTTPFQARWFDTHYSDLVTSGSDSLNLPTKACIQLFSRLMLSAYSLPTAKARPKEELSSNRCHFIVNYECAAKRANGRKAFRLANWNAVGVSGSRMKVDDFLSEHGVKICLLNKPHLESDQALRFANCLPPDGQSGSG